MVGGERKGSPWFRMARFPRKGIKPGRNRMRRGFPEAPSGAGRGSADRANHTGFRGEGLRESAGAAGEMVGGGSYAIV